MLGECHLLLQERPKYMPSNYEVSCSFLLTVYQLHSINFAEHKHSALLLCCVIRVIYVESDQMW